MATSAPRVKVLESVPQAPPDEVQVILQHTQTWLRTTLSRLAIAITVLAVLLLISLAGNFVLMFSAARVRYFGVTPDLRVVQLKPLTEPVLTASGLKEWTHDTVIRSLSLDFSNYRRQLSDVEPRYTPAAFTSFKAALQSAGILELIVHGRLVTSVTSEGAPVLVSEQRLGGVLHWQIEFPVSMGYESSKGIERTQYLLARVLVKRVPPTESLEGVRIAQIILAPG
jgi:intracellular multiplication protein IcmL